MHYLLQGVGIDAIQELCNDTYDKCLEMYNELSTKGEIRLMIVSEEDR